MLEKKLNKNDNYLQTKGNCIVYIRTMNKGNIREEDIDWIMLGRAAILNHNFPELYADNPEFETPVIPVSVEYLAGEGLSPKFINYMSNWGFVDGYDDKMKEALTKA